MQLVFCFFSTFFNIYIYSFQNDINLILFSNLSLHLWIIIFTVIFYKIASKRIMSIMFKASFFVAIVMTLITFLLTPQRAYLVFIVQFFYAITASCYYLPSEVSTMSKNNKSQMKKFLGLHSALSVFALVLSPFLSGVIIDFVSYHLLFAIMCVFSFICFILSFKLSIVDHDPPRMKMKEFFKVANQEKAVKLGYWGYFFSKFSLDGPIDIIIAVILFMKTGSNFGVGLYSALASFIACILLILYSCFSKKQAFTMWICSICLFAVSILVLISNSIVAFFIYYFTKAITAKLLTVDINSNLYTLVNHTMLRDYVINQRIAHTIFNKSAIIISIVICFLLYNFTHSFIGLSIFFVACSLFQLMSTGFVAKSYGILREKEDYQKTY